MEARFRRNYFECRQCALRRLEPDRGKRSKEQEWGERIEEARGMRRPLAQLRDTIHGVYPERDVAMP